jgi:hypothetical protein
VTRYRAPVVSGLPITDDTGTAYKTCDGWLTALRAIALLKISPCRRAMRTDTPSRYMIEPSEP